MEEFEGPEYFEAHFHELSKRPNKVSDSIIKNYLLNRYYIDNYFCCLKDSEMKSVLKVFIKYGYIPDGDIHIMAEQIRDKNFITFTRTTPWYFSTLNSLDYTGNHRSFDYCKANFHLQNQWGRTSNEYRHLLVYTENLDIVWADLGNYTDFDINNHIEQEDQFISKDGTVYYLVCILSTLWLFTNPCNKYSRLPDLQEDTLDGCIIKVCEEEIKRGHGSVLDLEYSKNVDLSAILGADFFKKGIKGKHITNTLDITNLKSVSTDNKRFCIEIENNTFNVQKTKAAYLDIETLTVSNKRGGRKLALEDWEEPCCG
ncbi:hypothetical protein FACS189442_0290 [Spirochaetia bacterium]|nr:hypothetical protein FACS189442_0290 [Spirochaetia bacterium]